MCIETMDVRSTQSSCVRRKDNPVSQMRWRVLRVSAHREEQGLRLCRVNMTTTIPKYPRREHQRVEPYRYTKVIGRKDQKTPMSKRSASAAWLNSRPAGAMAPGNTTQYLMSKVYEDVTTNGAQSVRETDVRNENVYRDCLSPMSVYAELDSCYESSIDFQTQDFEEVFDRYWVPE